MTFFTFAPSPSSPEDMERAASQFFQIITRRQWERAFKNLEARIETAAAVSSDLAREQIEQNALLYLIQKFSEAVHEDGHPYRRMREQNLQTAFSFIWMVGNVFAKTTDAGRVGLRNRFGSEVKREHAFGSLQVEMALAQLALSRGAEVHFPEFEAKDRQKSEPDLAVRKNGIVWWGECKMMTYDKGKGFTRRDLDALIKFMNGRADFQALATDRLVSVKFLDVPAKDEPRQALFARVLSGLDSGAKRLQTKEFELAVQDLPMGTVEPASGAAGRAQAEKLFPGQEVGFVFGFGDSGGPTMLINVASDNANPLDVWRREISLARSQLGPRENKIVACQVQNLFRSEIDEHNLTPAFDLTAARAMADHPDLCQVVFSLQGTVPTAFSRRDEADYSYVCNNGRIDPSRLIL